MIIPRQNRVASQLIRMRYTFFRNQNALTLKEKCMTLILSDRYLSMCDRGLIDG